MEDNTYSCSYGPEQEHLRQCRQPLITFNEEMASVRAKADLDRIRNFTVVMSDLEFICVCINYFFSRFI